MRVFLLLVLFVFNAFLGFAQRKTPLLELSVAGGYQSTDFRWSIAGNSNGKSPDVLSEVKWEGVSGVLFRPQLTLNLSNRWLVGGRFSQCFVRRGTATDTDYSADQRQGQVYYALLRSDEGKLSDFSMYSGYKIVDRSKFGLTLMAGYTEKRENLFLLNLTADVPGERNLRSNYQTKWKGAYVAALASTNITPKLALSALLSYSQLTYKASADWNLIDAFQHPVSFMQNADGYDLEASLSCIYKLNPHVFLNLSGTAGHAVTGNGLDQLFLDSGTTQVTQFNGAVKNLKSLSLGCVVRF